MVTEPCRHIFAAKGMRSVVSLYMNTEMQLLKDLRMCNIIMCVRILIIITKHPMRLYKPYSIN